MPRHVVVFDDGQQVLNTGMYTIHTDLPVDIKQNYDVYTFKEPLYIHIENLLVQYDPYEKVLKHSFTQMLEHKDGVDYIVVWRSGIVGVDTPFVVDRFTNYTTAKIKYSCYLEDIAYPSSFDEYRTIKYMSYPVQDLVSFQPILNRSEKNIPTVEACTTYQKYNDFDEEKKMFIQLLISSDFLQSETMKAMENDLTRTALGYPTQLAIDEATATLSALETLYKSNNRTGFYKNITAVDLSNTFHMYIPCYSVDNRLPMIDTITKVAEKRQLLQALGSKSFREELVLPYPRKVDLMLGRLENPPVKLSNTANIYKFIDNCIRNTGRSDAQPHSLLLRNVYTFDKTETCLGDTGNPNYLLWHGTLSPNIYNILKEGYKTSSLDSGVMFGAGIYFADTVAKAAHYCIRDVENEDIILLLNEVQLGKMYPASASIPDLVKPPAGYDSVKGNGLNFPRFEDHAFDSYGGLIYSGKLRENMYESIGLKFNEYVVYNKSQVKVRYLVHIKVNFENQH